MIPIFETISNISSFVFFYVLLPPPILFILYLIALEVYVYFKSKQEGPITLTPVIPFPQDDLEVFKGSDDFKNVVPEAKIQVYNGKTETIQEPQEPRNCFKKYFVYVEINEFMASTFKLHCRLPDEYEVEELYYGRNNYKMLPKISVPNNARTISIKMNGYEHGEKCHDFEPIGGAAPGSHFTYQMYGDNRIQVTRYEVNGRSEVAGFCIYIEHPWLSPTEYRWSSIKNITRFVKISANSPITEERRNVTNQPKIEVNPEENTNLMSHDSDDREWTGKYNETKQENTKLISLVWTVKYCSKLQRKVMSSTDSGEVVVHQEWSDKSNYMKIEKCEECTEEGLGNEEQPPTYSSIFIA
ncbi:unnamed protein product [Caenorhabditis brenneri]